MMRLRYHVQRLLSDGSWHTEYTTPFLDEAQRGATAIGRQDPKATIRIIDSEGHEVFV